MRVPTQEGSRHSWEFRPAADFLICSLAPFCLLNVRACLFLRSQLCQPRAPVACVYRTGANWQSRARFPEIIPTIPNRVAPERATQVLRKARRFPSRSTAVRAVPPLLRHRRGTPASGSETDTCTHGLLSPLLRHYKPSSLTSFSIVSRSTPTAVSPRRLSSSVHR